MAFGPGPLPLRRRRSSPSPPLSMSSSSGAAASACCRSLVRKLFRAPSSAAPARNVSLSIVALFVALQFVSYWQVAQRSSTRFGTRNEGAVGAVSVSFASVRGGTEAGALSVSARERPFRCPPDDGDNDRVGVNRSRGADNDANDDDDVLVFPSSALLDLWNELETLVKSYPKSAVSGGINLYPRQGALLTEMVRRLVRRKEKSLVGQKEERPERTGVVTVCETGFGSGHSAALFLSASPAVRVLTFDMFQRPYQLPALKMLEEKFGADRIKGVEGDSCMTVPEYFGGGGQDDDDNGADAEDRNVDATDDAFRKCDLLHGSSLCKSDNLDLISHAAVSSSSSCPGFVPLTSTAMNSLDEEAVYFGQKAQWRKLRRDGCVSNITCYEERPTEADKDYVFARKGTPMSHKFCFAVSTGRCSLADADEKKECDLGKGTGEGTTTADLIDFGRDCPHFKTNIPA